MKINEKTDPKKAFEHFRSELKSIKKDIQEGGLSKDDIPEIQTALNDLELSLLQAKASAMLDSLIVEKPFLSSKMALMEILNILPVDVKKEHLSSITKFVLDNWKEQPQKLSA